jgi:hypothetical protein
VGSASCIFNLLFSLLMKYISARSFLINYFASKQYCGGSTIPKYIIASTGWSRRGEKLQRAAGPAVILSLFLSCPLVYLYIPLPPISFLSASSDLCKEKIKLIFKKKNVIYIRHKILFLTKVYSIIKISFNYFFKLIYIFKKLNK